MRVTSIEPQQAERVQNRSIVRLQLQRFLIHERRPSPTKRIATVAQCNHPAPAHIEIPPAQCTEPLDQPSPRTRLATTIEVQRRKRQCDEIVIMRVRELPKTFLHSRRNRARIRLELCEV